MRNNFLVWIGMISLALASCTPKAPGVLRAPSQTTGNVDSKTDDPGDVDLKDKEVDGKMILTGNIALVLPFQLHKVASNALSEEDVKRSSLALDFYQGFQLGLDQIVGSNRLIGLHVLDSRDDAGQSSNLASSQEVNSASLVVGPIYPTEIRSFGANFRNKDVLQINPLAASMPTEFNLPNLVSITPPISVHMRAISAQVAGNYRDGDVIVVYNTNNNDHRQFIDGFLQDIKERLPDGKIVSVSSVSQMNDQLSSVGKNHVITGTTDRNQIKGLLDNLDDLYFDQNYAFQLYGHPLWDRFDFSSYSNFRNYNPIITAESHLNPDSRAVQDFQRLYRESFGISPSDHAYKGYDAGVYFGKMLDKYGERYPEHLVNEVHNGLFSNYKFNHNDRWGYVNFGVIIKAYRSRSFEER